MSACPRRMESRRVSLAPGSFRGVRCFSVTCLALAAVAVGSLWAGPLFGDSTGAESTRADSAGTASADAKLLRPRPLSPRPSTDKAAPGALFADDFETGDLSAWSTSTAFGVSSVTFTPKARPRSTWPF